MAIFLLIRHGENDYVKDGRLAGRLPGVHLNQKGLQQAERVAELLAKEPVRAVYSSPLERTVETAKPTAHQHNCEVILRPGLIEIDVGEWQGQKIKDLRKEKAWKIVQNSPSQFQFPGGDTIVDAQSRICSDLAAIAMQHKEKDLVVCFSHSDPIKLAVAHYLGMPLDCFQRLAIAPASITALHLGKKTNRLLKLNQVFDTDKLIG